MLFCDNGFKYIVATGICLVIEDVVIVIVDVTPYENTKNWHDCIEKMYIKAIEILNVMGYTIIVF